MYSFDDYSRMMADHVRMDAYAYALKASIGPETTVLDLGAGAGIHALLACKFGARKVYAIETNQIIHLAQELARVNGYADRIEFIHDRSTDVTLPERVDVIVSDLRGVLPLFGEHIPTLVDARRRFLKPDGTLIPQRDVMWAAPVEAPRVYRDLLAPWDAPYGLSMDPAKRIALNSFSQDDTDLIRAGHLLAKPLTWVTLDYQSVEEADVGGGGVFTADRDGEMHGWLVWFDTELAAGVGFGNGPHVAKIADVYGRAFFPLLETVVIAAGDAINLDLAAEHEEDGYTWRWHTYVSAQHDPTVVKADFEQST